MDRYSTPEDPRWTQGSNGSDTDSDDTPRAHNPEEHSHSPSSTQYPKHRMPDSLSDRKMPPDDQLKEQYQKLVAEANGMRKELSFLEDSIQNLQERNEELVQEMRQKNARLFKIQTYIENADREAAQTASANEQLQNQNEVLAGMNKELARDDQMEDEREVRQVNELLVLRNHQLALKMDTMYEASVGLNERNKLYKEELHELREEVKVLLQNIGSTPEMMQMSHKQLREIDLDLNDKETEMDRIRLRAKLRSGQASPYPTLGGSRQITPRSAIAHLGRLDQFFGSDFLPSTAGSSRKGSNISVASREPKTPLSRSSLHSAINTPRFQSRSGSRASRSQREKTPTSSTQGVRFPSESSSGDDRPRHSPPPSSATPARSALARNPRFGPQLLRQQNAGRSLSICSTKIPDYEQMRKLARKISPGHRLGPSKLQNLLDMTSPPESITLADADSVPIVEDTRPRSNSLESVFFSPEFSSAASVSSSEDSIVMGRPLSPELRGKVDSMVAKPSNKLVITFGDGERSLLKLDVGSLDEALRECKARKPQILSRIPTRDGRPMSWNNVTIEHWKPVSAAASQRRASPGSEAVRTPASITCNTDVAPDQGSSHDHPTSDRIGLETSQIPGPTRHQPSSPRKHGSKAISSAGRYSPVAASPFEDKHFDWNTSEQTHQRSYEIPAVSPFETTASDMRLMSRSAADSELEQVADSKFPDLEVEHHASSAEPSRKSSSVYSSYTPRGSRDIAAVELAGLDIIVSPIRETSFVAPVTPPPTQDIVSPMAPASKETNEDLTQSPHALNETFMLLKDKFEHASASKTSKGKGVLRNVPIFAPRAQPGAPAESSAMKTDQELDGGKLFQTIVSARQDSLPLRVEPTEYSAAEVGTPKIDTQDWKERNKQESAKELDAVSPSKPFNFWRDMEQRDQKSKPVAGLGISTLSPTGSFPTPELTHTGSLTSSDEPSTPAIATQPFSPHEGHDTTHAHLTQDLEHTASQASEPHAISRGSDGELVLVSDYTKPQSSQPHLHKSEPLPITNRFHNAFWEQRRVVSATEAPADFEPIDWARLYLASSPIFGRAKGDAEDVDQESSPALLHSDEESSPVRSHRHRQALAALEGSPLPPTPRFPQDAGSDVGSEDGTVTGNTSGMSLEEELGPLLPLLDRNIRYWEQNVPEPGEEVSPSDSEPHRDSADLWPLRFSRISVVESAPDDEVLESTGPNAMVSDTDDGDIVGASSIEGTSYAATLLAFGSEWLTTASPYTLEAADVHPTMFVESEFDIACAAPLPPSPLLPIDLFATLAALSGVSSISLPQSLKHTADKALWMLYYVMLGFLILSAWSERAKWHDVNFNQARYDEIVGWREESWGVEWPWLHDQGMSWFVWLGGLDHLNV